MFGMGTHGSRFAFNQFTTWWNGAPQITAAPIAAAAAAAPDRSITLHQSQTALELIQQAEQIIL
jgi:hypothetical protein